jgi:hypothetical protein
MSSPSVYGSRQKLPASIKNPEKFKNILKLSRNDPVPINKISLLETILNTISINVSGDYFYTSGKLCDRVANLILSHGHYKVSKWEERKKPKGWSKEVRLPIIYFSDSKDGKIYFMMELENGSDVIRNYTSVRQIRILVNIVSCRFKLTKPLMMHISNLTVG